ncbi:arginase family protein, partial [Staphylococcus capitis]|uniref:arginase family protein n=1 Tax=Staphylococcus capitis TaxID=29388 RepID=UPI0016427D7E
LTLSRNLTEPTSQILHKPNFPLTLPPHHSIPLGSISPITQHYQNLPLISYHPHAHLNLPQESPSRNLHPMPLRILPP